MGRHVAITPMKILLVNNDKGWGGGQEFLQTLARQLMEQGCAVHILCRRDTPSAANFRAAGITVTGTGRGGIAPLLETAALLRRERFDIVMITREHDLLRTVLAWLLAFPLRKQGKLVMGYHTATIRRQLLLGSVAAAVCVSTYVRNRLLARNRSVADRTVVLSNGINVTSESLQDKFVVERPRRFFQGIGFPLIGMVGAFFKNQAELVDVLLMVRQAFPTVRLALVGDDSDNGLVMPLKEKIAAAGLADQVIFTGRLTRAQLIDVYHDLDLAVSTFRNEGFGLVHLESLAAGTPVVSYNEGGQVDIFQGTDAGVLVEGGPAEFAASVIGLLQDHERRFAMGKAGVKLVNSTFSVAMMGTRYLDFFQVLTDKRRGARL